jgi:YrbI family 3-deoxy-D-manno-octulosonate 8-phosphate phosphatase
MPVMKILKPQLIVYDFDGVMTDNKVYVDQNGNEIVQVNRADGLGVSEIKKSGVNQIILSTETNSVVRKRAEKLKISCIYGIDHKKEELENYCLKNGIDLDEVIYVGNDINDKDAMELVGWPMCPLDAVDEIKRISKYIFSSKGGEGVIRELYSLIHNKGGLKL